MKKIISIACIIFLISVTFSVIGISIKVENNDFLVGIDSNYELLMSYFHLRWRYNFQKVDIYELLSSKGVNALRLRVWTNDEGNFGKLYATQTAIKAQNNGMRPYVVLFLSDEWAAIDKQPAPKKWINDYNWENIGINQKANIVRNYTRDITLHFLNNGIDADIYEIGNEIDYGICGIYEEDYFKKENTSYMNNNTWKNMSIIIKAAIDGVKSIDQTSSFVLHITHWWDYNFSNDFYNTMIDNDVDFDYLGFSFYPSSGIYNITDAFSGKVNGTLSQEKFKINMEKLHTTFDRPIIVAEYAYPSSGLIIGMFSTFNNEVKNYPLSHEGQKEWLVDFLNWCKDHSYITGTFYFSPEFYMFYWAPMSLFNYFGKSKPAIEAFIEIGG